MKSFRSSHNASLLFGVLAGLYILLNLVLPPNHASQSLYHLSNTQYHVLIFFVILPVILIWSVAFYGYARMKEYATLIENEPEGPAFRQVANGMMWLAWGLPIPALISLFVNTIANEHPGFYSTSIVITNYANLLVPLAALNILATGSRILFERAKLVITNRNTKILIALFVALGAIYCYYVFRNIDASPKHNPYYLPAWLVLTTVVIPYLYAWFVGLLAAYEMRMVSRNSQGVIYRRALELTSAGLAVTVASSIALQYIRSVFPRDGHLSLGYTLLLIYALLILIACGYALLAAGAQRMKRIEEV